MFKPTPISYDPECEWLARHFLADYHGEQEASISDLAQVIQIAIEDYFFDLEDSAIGANGDEEPLPPESKE